MKKIVSILGARPQFVKAAVLSRIIAEKNDIKEVIVHTGQHYDANMSDIFFDDMHIPKPKYNLNINGLGHGAMTGQMLEKIEAILQIEKPDAVVVYGDTNSTLAGALAAKKLHIKVIHIEAGLRSFNMKMPEEINRIITDRIADLLLCPTQKSMDNLKAEGFENMDIDFVLTGDIMKEAVTFYSTMVAEKATVLQQQKLTPEAFVLATIHRQENTDNLDNLKNIFKALDHISKTCQVILPIHPRTKGILEKHHIKTQVTLIEPVGYFDMLALLQNCKMVITDSGGLQKEAFFNQKFCIVARTETEWVELVDNGFAKIAGSDYEKIMTSFRFFDNKEKSFSKPLYGDKVGETIYAEILRVLS
ncbi:MAG: UDP-N-acetylglucosamine 2-epimerase (non-hydrolyzing) [Flavobacteriales bacterium]|jgi:UDP-GlcNAc3NAcA epimerase|nr:UDP-N-acetylglucosamine 2-epimerase (non-hydrolyzing) [Flavobacteriales bacterium]